MPNKTQSIILSGVAIGVGISLLSQVPIVGGCLGCLAYIGAGLMALWHYTDTYEVTLAGGQGAGMGALAGLVAGTVSGLLGFLLLRLGITPDPATQFDQAVDAGQMDPEIADQIIAFFDSPYLLIVSLAISWLIGAIMGAIGGAIGASVFKKGGDMPTDFDEA